MRAPFPYFGSKLRAAKQIWTRFSDPQNYVEPFCGSAATLLNRPGNPRIETINDVDGFITNCFRAIKADPDEVAKYVTDPVNEIDLTARHKWLLDQDIKQKMFDDPEFHDCKIAGWWAWGQSQWLGAGWCDVKSRQQKPALMRSHQGVNRISYKKRRGAVGPVAAKII